MIPPPASIPPGLHYAARISPTGQILEQHGHLHGDPTATAVLIQATLSAAIDLGQRSALGPCRDIALHYEHGSILATPTTEGHILLLQHTPSTPEHLHQLRQLAQELLTPPPSLSQQPTSVPPITRPTDSSLMDALNVPQP